MWLGIDPGRSKCGWALVRPDGELFASGIIPSDIPRGWVAEILDLCSPREPIKSIIIGAGTGHKNIVAQLNEHFDLKILVINEKGTTLAARSLYWKIHPPSGLWKFVPTSIRVPPRDIDDLAAWAIVLKMIEKGEI